MAKERKVLKDFRGAKDGQFHIVHFRQYNPKTRKLESRGYEVYFDNKPYLRVNRHTTGGLRMSRREAKTYCRLLNGEARWAA